MCLTCSTSSTNCFLSSVPFSILDFLSLLLFSSNLRLFQKDVSHLWAVLSVGPFLSATAGPPHPISLSAPPPLPPAFYIPSCRALSSNNFFVSRSDESLYIIVSKMEQRWPIPEGGGACKEKGTGSCTRQADSGFRISKQQNRTWETICLQYRERVQTLGMLGVEKRMEKTFFTQVPSLALRYRILSSGFLWRLGSVRRLYLGCETISKPYDKQHLLKKTDVHLPLSHWFNHIWQCTSPAWGKEGRCKWDGASILGAGVGLS